MPLADDLSKVKYGPSSSPYGGSPYAGAAGSLAGGAASTLLGSLLDYSNPYQRSLGKLGGQLAGGLTSAMLQPGPFDLGQWATYGGLPALGGTVGGLLGGMVDEQWGAPVGSYLGSLGVNALLGAPALASGLMGLPNLALGIGTQFIDDPQLRQALNVGLSPMLSTVTPWIGEALGLISAPLATSMMWAGPIGAALGMGLAAWQGHKEHKAKQHMSEKQHYAYYTGLKEAEPALSQITEDIFDIGRQRILEIEARGENPADYGLDRFGFTQDEWNYVSGQMRQGAASTQLGQTDIRVPGTGFERGTFVPATPAEAAFTPSWAIRSSYAHHPAPMRDVQQYEQWLYNMAGGMAPFLEPGQRSGSPKDIDNYIAYLNYETAKMLGEEYDPTLYSGSYEPVSKTITRYQKERAAAERYEAYQQKLEEEQRAQAALMEQYGDMGGY